MLRHKLCEKNKSRTEPKRHPAAHGTPNMQSSAQAEMAMDQSIARDACSALSPVTGQWTAEYGPLGAAKRKMLRVQNIATRARSPLKWRDVNIGEKELYIVIRYKWNFSQAKIKALVI